MTVAQAQHGIRSLALLIAGTIVIGCDAATEPSGLRVAPQVATAKSPAVTVTAASPSFGYQGQTDEVVTITGSGFAPGAQAAWLRNGVVDTTITVTSTQYVSPTTLIARINISPKAAIDLRDVQVTTLGRTQGIGSLMFEITQAIEIPGTSLARSINDNGEATGTLASGDGVFYYSTATSQLETVSTTGTGYDISPKGTAIVGSAGGGGGQPYLFTRTGPGGTWQATALPVGTTTTSGVARAMIADTTGQVVVIGGMEYTSQGTRAVSWTWQAASGTWQRTVLPPDGSSSEIRHRAVSSTGVFGGTTAAPRTLGPAVWVPNGSGGYLITTLASSGAVNGVRSDGGMIVGFTSVPVYWLALPGGGWSAPVTVAGGCNSIKDVSDASRFVLNGCPMVSNGKAKTFPAYGDTPYTSLTRLGGLGPSGTPGFVAGVSHSGHFASGNVYLTTNTPVGVYWIVP
jgi:hypothetical protein